MSDDVPKELAFFVTNPSQLGEGQTVTFVIEFIPCNQISGPGGRTTWREYPTYVDGSSTIDRHEITFTVGRETPEILPQSVEFGYPVVHQNYYLQGANTAGSDGFIKLRYRNPALQAANLAKTVKIFVNNQVFREIAFEYVQYNDIQSGAAIKYTMPVLPNSADVRLELFVQAGTGNAASSGNSGPQRIYSMSFRTSKYNTFQEKLASASRPAFKNIALNSYLMNCVLFTDEGFDSFEIGQQGQRIGHIVRPFITQSFTDLNTDWHTQAFQAIRNEQSSPRSFPQPYPHSKLGMEQDRLAVLLDANESMASVLMAQTLPEPGQGTYSYTFYYEPPTLLSNGLLDNITGVSPFAGSSQVSNNSLSNNPDNNLQRQGVHSGAEFINAPALSFGNSTAGARQTFQKATVNISYAGYRASFLQIVQSTNAQLAPVQGQAGRPGFLPAIRN